MAGEREGRDHAVVVLGLVAPSGSPRELAEQIATELPGQIGDHLLSEDVGLRRRRGKTRRAHRLGQRLEELRSPLGRSRAHDDGTIAFVGATLRGNLRLLVGMIRANQPARLTARLSNALAVSLGTAAYAMSSSTIWILSHGMAWPRLALLGAASIITLCAVLVLAHGLWEGRPGSKTGRLSFSSISPLAPHSVWPC